MKAFYETRQFDSHIKLWHSTYKNARFIAHWHAETEFIFIRKGSIEVTVGEKTVRANEGDLLICDSGEIHYSSLEYNENILDFLIFDPSIVNNTFESFSLKTPLITKAELKKTNLYNHLISLFKLVFFEKNKKDIYYDEVISAALKLFCYKFQRATVNIVDKNKNNPNKDRIDEIQMLLEYIENNFDKNINLEFAANMMHLSESYFSTLFKEYTGSTFIKYLNSIRIEHALIEMQKKSKNITEIALSNGFNNIRTFNRVFKEYTGKTPSAFSKLSNQEYNQHIHKVRKSAHMEHTEKSQNKTLIPEFDFL